MIHAARARALTSANPDDESPRQQNPNPSSGADETRAQVSSLDAMADAAMGPQLERAESVPMEIMNKCAYGEPSTKTIMVMGAVAAVLASIIENRQSKLGKMKSVVVADPKTPPAAESVRKEADKLAAAVETAAEEVKPVAEAAPKKKRGFSPFKGFGKKKEA